MPDSMEDLFLKQRPSPDRPLRGQTVLVVEDSRFASEALRLICLRSGARVRRADSLASAARHLANYRPGVVVIDIGLPDGSGLDLIRNLAATTPPVPAIVAISGDPTEAEAALVAGAAAFLEKPLSSLAAFQETVLALLPNESHPLYPHAINDDYIDPDRLALKDDLSAVAEELKGLEDPARLPYLAQFMSTLAASSGDDHLSALASEMDSLTRSADPGPAALALAQKIGRELPVAKAF